MNGQLSIAKTEGKPLDPRDFNWWIEQVKIESDKVRHTLKLDPPYRQTHEWQDPKDERHDP